jgi:hypothetical protein
MANTFHPTQIGFTPSGDKQTSQVVIGKDTRTNWEAIGFGPVGRPDVLEKLVINFTQVSGTAPAGMTPNPSFRGKITIDVNEIVEIIKANPPLTVSGVDLRLREILVCVAENDGDAGTEQKMLILASQPYISSL